MCRLTWSLVVLVGMLAAAGCGPRPAATPAAPPDSAAARAEAFRWFGGLGFPDVKGRPFVRAATGRWYRLNGQPPENTYVRGFLLDDRGPTFTVLTLSLDTETVQKTRAGVPEHERAGYERADLAGEVTAGLKVLRQPGAAERRGDLPADAIARLSRTETFVLAWACGRNGLDRLAGELFDHAARMPNGYGTNGDQPPTRPLQELVAEDLALIEMWRAVLACGDPAVPRPELRRRFERIVRHYPASEHSGAAREMADQLRRMIAEDAEHAARKPARPFEQWGRKEQIAELIFRLRDQNGHQFSQPGHCDVFADWGQNHDTPAHGLARIGYDAVPALIEALDDQRLTRSVGYQRDSCFSHYVLRVGDCAVAILERIAGRSFWRPISSCSYMTKDKQTAATKGRVRAWYADLKQKGERQILIEAVERGGLDSDEQARRLVRDYPAAALPAIRTGLRAAREENVRDRLVAAAAGLKGDAPVALLLEEARQGPSVSGRLVAAEKLHARGRPEGVAAMIDEWEGRRAPKVTPPERQDRRTRRPGALLPSVAAFLATCGQVEAVNALARGLRRRPVGLRVAVVSAFGEAGMMSMMSMGGGAGGIQPGNKAPADDPAAVREAAERLLVAALDDTEEQFGLSGSWGGKSFADPRVCDVAAHVLNQRAPTK